MNRVCSHGNMQLVPKGFLSLCDNLVVDAMEMNATDMMNDELSFT